MEQIHAVAMEPFKFSPKYLFTQGFLYILAVFKYLDFMTGLCRLKTAPRMHKNSASTHRMWKSFSFQSKVTTLKCNPGAVLQHFPVGRVCSGVFSTGKFQFPFYETKKGKDSAEMFQENHKSNLTDKHVFYFICTFMMCSWTPHAGKTRAFFNLWGPKADRRQEWVAVRASEQTLVSRQARNS